MSAVAIRMKIIGGKNLKQLFLFLYLSPWTAEDAFPTPSLYLLFLVILNSTDNGAFEAGHIAF